LEEEAIPRLRLNSVEAQGQASVVDLLQDQADSEAEVAAGLEAVSVVVTEVGSTEEDLEEAAASEEVEVASKEEAEVGSMEEEVAMVLVVAALATKVMALHPMAHLLVPEEVVALVEVEDQDMTHMTVVSVACRPEVWEAMAVPMKEALVEATWSLCDPEATGMVMTAAMATEDRLAPRLVTLLSGTMDQIVVRETEVPRERGSMMEVTKTREREVRGIDRMMLHASKPTTSIPTQPSTTLCHDTQIAKHSSFVGTSLQA